MGTKYTTDEKLGDFIKGQATGAGYNDYSRLGASLYRPQARRRHRALPQPRHSKSFRQYHRRKTTREAEDTRTLGS